MEMQQLTVQDSQLQAKWDAFFQDLQDRITAAALDWPETRRVEISFHEIQLRDPDLADYVLQKPQHSLRIAQAALRQVDVPVLDRQPALQLRIEGLPDSQRVMPRDLRAEHLGHMLAVEGLVKKVTEVRPQVQEAAFECKRCTSVEYIVQEEELLQEPVICSGCEQPGPWRLLEEQCGYLDHQKVEIQESPEGLRGGAQPERLTVFLRDDLVHTTAPGDRVRLNGVLTVQPRRQGSQKRTEFNKVLYCNSVELQEQEFQEINLTEEDEEEILELSRDERIYDRLRASFAPTIYGLQMEKDALILALFGGVAKEYKDSSRTRGDVHVLLVGDPGVAKSQLLRYLSKLAPRSIFTSGKSASAAGLTAAAVKDEFGEGQWTLEAGALVMADMGIACIDELDKMTKQDQSSMHQAMEQQEISIAKAGISATLKSRCAVVAAANPKLGRFDPYEPIHAQINLPPALFSRFDLIFSLQDKPDREFDEKLANHILRTHQAGQVHEYRKNQPTGRYSVEDEQRLLQRVEPDLAPDLLRKYVAYSKTHITPVLSDEALDAIREFYVDLRGSGDDGVPITARQLEAIVRLTEASARIRLSQEATMDDARRALRIFEHYLRSVGVDRETGKFDIDVINTGVSHSQHERIRSVQDVIKDLAGQSSKGFAMEEDVLSECKRRGVDREQAKKALSTLIRNNSVYAKGGSGTYAPL